MYVWFSAQYLVTLSTYTCDLVHNISYMFELWVFIASVTTALEGYNTPTGDWQGQGCWKVLTPTTEILIKCHTSLT